MRIKKTPLLRPTQWLLGAVLCGVTLSFTADEALAAEPLSAPEGRVLLTLTGNIGVTNSGTNSALEQTEQAEFDLALLDSLPQHEFDTETPWTNGVHRFSGVLLRDLLERVDAKGVVIKAVAFNEYFSVIDISRPELSGLLLATRMDGEPMRIRDKGPSWLMLPLSESKQLDNKRFHELLIWQLRTLDVQ
ncbi:hypothetical protein CBP31_14100 [Oceanisphaera profunda]|uniref:Oxidoreductase molybdopterin-binding domain-containing protein n=1 Tax=Oceanisphaera profunda TaxID=1416627 RepID=A0A1Y0D7V6_9GAMM|nr:hypothetical protein [Oceanisphaera profunda]ART83622.1 hypothetical protein CBP31_14100 [Oceanisphaera profunda]